MNSCSGAISTSRKLLWARYQDNVEVKGKFGGTIDWISSLFPPVLAFVS
jgi:hypothetical protein